MELTENMEEFLNDLIGKRMEQVYQENDGEQYDPFNEELELKVQKVIRKLPPKQGKDYNDLLCIKLNLAITKREKRTKKNMSGHEKYER